MNGRAVLEFCNFAIGHYFLYDFYYAAGVRINLKGGLFIAKSYYKINKIQFSPSKKPTEARLLTRWHLLAKLHPRPLNGLVVSSSICYLWSSSAWAAGPLQRFKDVIRTLESSLATSIFLLSQRIFHAHDTAIGCGLEGSAAQAAAAPSILKNCASS